MEKEKAIFSHEEWKERVEETKFLGVKKTMTA